jgi:hypothetical protein
MGHAAAETSAGPMPPDKPADTAASEIPSKTASPELSTAAVPQDAPTATVSPDRPIVAAAPDKPTVAVAPDKPAVAIVPDKPTVAVTPDKPTVMVVPDKPIVAEVPDKPTVADAPDKPTGTVAPDKPVVTVESDKPDATVSPDKPPTAVSLDPPAKAADIPPTKPRDPGWIVSETTSPVDYAPVITAAIRLPFSVKHAPNTFAIRCRGRRTEVLVRTEGTWRASRAREVQVDYQINDQPLVKLSWSASADGRTAIYKEDPVGLVQSLPDGAQLKINVLDESGSGHEATFELTGLDPVRERIATACKWTSGANKVSSEKR